MIQLTCLFSLVLCQCGYGYPIESNVREGTSIQNATSFIISSASISQPHNISVNTNITTDPANIIGQLYNSTANSIYHEVINEQFNTAHSSYHEEFNQLYNNTAHSSYHEKFNQHYSNTSNGSYHKELLGFGKKVVAKVKGGINKVKTKVKVGIGKIKNKISDVKNKISDVKNKISDVKNKIGGGKTGGGKTDGGKTGVGIGTNYYRRPYNRNTSSGGGTVDPTFLWVLLGLGIAGVLGTILYFVVKK